MSLKTLFLLLFFSVHLWSDFFHLSSKKLTRLCSNPPPQWMQEQIDEDLAPFQSLGILRKDIKKTLKTVAPLVLVSIKDNKVSWSHPKDFSQDHRFARLLDLLNEAAKFVTFPDAEFPVTVLDCYDYPEYLCETHAPVFTICKQVTNHKAILWPEMRGFKSKMILKQWIKKAEQATPWEKKAPMAVWRGRSTGIFLTEYDWDSIVRVPLVFFSEKHPDLLDAKFSGTHWANMNTRRFIVDSYVSNFLRPMDQIKYKYLIAVDGNTFPSSLMWQLYAHSTVIKNRSNYIEWYHKGLKEGVHYVPYEPDCSDLEKIILSLRKNDAKAKEIAENATAYANQYLNAETAAAYLYHLLHAYAPLLKDD